MKNYSDIELSKIDLDIKSYLHVIDKGIAWGKAHLKHDDQHDLLLALKSSKKAFTKMSDTLLNKPAIALFGASQVGKSYLIKNLLSIQGKPFHIENNKTQFDFLKDINPTGGAESTGVVTRFTNDINLRFDNFPVKVKLLSAKDIILIVCDAFFLDSKKITTYPSSVQFEEILSKLENNTNNGNNQAILNEFDMLDCKEYFELHFYKHALLLEVVTKTRFFERIGKVISNYQYTEWPAIFAVLWDNNPCLTELFIDLIFFLNKLKYDSIIYLEFDSVLREKYAILDVKRLHELNTNKAEILVKKEDGEELNVNLSYVSALISELIFKVPDQILEDKPFLKNSDLLDFPGARSRLAMDVSDMDTDIKHQLLLRGKVSYLFNKYSDEYNVNNLLFCANDRQLEINEISSLLFNWIERNIGQNENERSLTLQNNKIDPLFIIFTFFNTQLKYDSTNDYDFVDQTKLNYKWNNRFNLSFQNEIVTQARGWHKKWTNEKKMFSNLYLLRDFKYSTDIFQGFEESEQESSIVHGREEYFLALKKSFLEFEFVKNHFTNPEISWESSASLNNDGTKLIIENLNLVSNNFLKIRNYQNKIQSEIEKLRSLLKQYAHIDNLSDQRMSAFKKSSDLQFSLITYFSKDRLNFINLLKCFYVKPTEIYNLLNENIVSNGHLLITETSTATQLLVTQFPSLKNTKNHDEVLEILKNELFIDSIEEVEKFLKEKEISINQLIDSDKELSLAASLVEVIFNGWEQQWNANYSRKHLGISEVQYNFLGSHYKKLFILRGLKTKLLAIFTSVLNELESNRGSEEFLSEVVALIINDMVNNFDINILTKDMLSDIEGISKAYNLDFNNLQRKNNNTSDNKDIANFFNDSKSSSLNLAIEKYSSWINKLKISVIASCGFIDYDEAANNELKSIIFDIKQYQFN